MCSSYSRRSKKNIMGSPFAGPINVGIITLELQIWRVAIRHAAFAPSPACNFVEWRGKIGRDHGCASSGEEINLEDQSNSFESVLLPIGIPNPHAGEPEATRSKKNFQFRNSLCLVWCLLPFTRGVPPIIIHFDTGVDFDFSPLVHAVTDGILLIPSTEFQYSLERLKFWSSV
ncbi:hypothetical protein B0H17DRAFT_1125557 [Mycena rosella]|uniref:Uncharacterized protein n=1 Tax=Mycena rosella TaxID=1033263 RepID=A0AAD7GWG3_MYCRO|nr:hypothetical protein B0H17DRAFT_1125557 [Mycena rosella]